jgi:hypothetical protein
MGKSRVAHVLHQQAADHLVACDNLHRAGVEGNGIRLTNAAIRLRIYLNLLKSPHVTKHFL